MYEISCPRGDWESAAGAVDGSALLRELEGVPRRNPDQYYSMDRADNAMVLG